MTSQNSKHAKSENDAPRKSQAWRPTSQDRMRAISLAPALKLTAVQLREHGTVVKTHYEESVIATSETLEKSTLGDVNCCFGQGRGHRVRIVRSDEPRRQYL